MTRDPIQLLRAAARAVDEAAVAWSPEGGEIYELLDSAREKMSDVLTKAGVRL